MAQSLPRRTRRVAHGSRAQTVGLLGDGTHAQAMAPALGARTRQAARGNRFVKGQLYVEGENTQLRRRRKRQSGMRRLLDAGGRGAPENNSWAASSASQSGSLARGVRRGNGCSRSAIHRCGRRISRRRRAAPQIAPQRAASETPSPRATHDGLAPPLLPCATNAYDPVIAAQMDAEDEEKNKPGGEYDLEIREVYLAAGFLQEEATLSRALREHRARALSRDRVRDLTTRHGSCTWFSRLVY